MIISPTKSSRSCQFFSGIATSISCLSSSGLMRPMKLVAQDRDQDDRDLRLVGREEAEHPPERLVATLLRQLLDRPGRTAEPAPTAAATAAAARCRRPRRPRRRSQAAEPTATSTHQSDAITRRGNLRSATDPWLVRAIHAPPEISSAGCDARRGHIAPAVERQKRANEARAKRHVVKSARCIRSRPGSPTPTPSHCAASRSSGCALYEARRRAGLTQRRLAYTCGVHQSTISRLERGRLDGIRLKKLALIVAALESLSVVDPY